MGDDSDDDDDDDMAALDGEELGLGVALTLALTLTLTLTLTPSLTLTLTLMSDREGFASVRQLSRALAIALDMNPDLAPMMAHCIYIPQDTFPMDE